MAVIRTILTAAFVTFACFAPPAIAQTTTRATTTTTQATTAPTAAEIDTLIKQLDADAWATRTRAAARIVHIGEPARAALQRVLAAGNASAEVTEQARTALSKLD